MPSGLTCKIYEGSDMTLRGFALRCVRQLGAGYEATNQGEKEMPLYEAPIIPLSDYNLKALEKAKKEVEYWLNVEKNPEEADRLYNEEKARRKSRNEEYSCNKSEIKARYLTMKSKVEAWNLSDTYASLKELMLKQLDESIDWDCKPYVPYEYPLETKEEWLKNNLAMACRDVEYHIEAYKKEVERNKELNGYLKGLYDAIDKVEPL